MKKLLVFVFLISAVSIVAMEEPVKRPKTTQQEEKQQPLKNKSDKNRARREIKIHDALGGIR